MRTRLYSGWAILFCFAAALHRSSHSTGIPAETTYDVCCRRCMYTRYVFICWYSIPCSTGDHIASRTGVIFWFSGQTNFEADVEREVPSPVGRACLALLGRFATVIQPSKLKIKAKVICSFFSLLIGRNAGEFTYKEWWHSHNWRRKTSSKGKFMFDFCHSNTLRLLLVFTSFPLVLGGFECDVTCQSC